MLRDLDDTLYHQASEGFDHVGVTDVRFYDRYWFALYAPDGSLGMNIGMGLFSNQNVMDCAATAIAGGRQYSFLASRALRPDFSTKVGPLSVIPVEPLRELHLLLEPSDYGLSYDLRWRGTWDAREEKPAFTRVNGRTSQRTCRFDQVGEVSGWVELDGTRYEADKWFGGRDHSWGVRDGVAGLPFPERTGPVPPGYALWFVFATETRAGNLSFSWIDGVAHNLTGTITRKDGRDEVDDDIVAVLDLEVERYEGTRRFQKAKVTVSTARGDVVEIECEELVRAFAMTGVGYMGFKDRLGHGLWRGDYYEEWNVWNVSHPEDVILESGEVERPWHRDAGVTVAVDGEPGLGHLMLMVTGD